MVWQRVSLRDCLPIFPCVSFIYAESRLRDAQPERKLGSVGWGVTESGALFPSLSFLNGLSAGKATANAPHSQVSGYRPSGCVELLRASSRGVATWISPKRPFAGKTRWMNHADTRLQQHPLPRGSPLFFSTPQSSNVCGIMFTII